MEKNYAGIMPGDAVTAYGKTYTVDRVLYSEYWDRYGYDIEFIDPRGGYHHWKQWDDGGDLVKKGDRSATREEKKLVNYYGDDCSDIFKKYGLLK